VYVVWPCECSWPLGPAQAALSVAGNSSFPSLVQSRYNALVRITRGIEAEVRKARASLGLGGASGAPAAAGAGAPKPARGEGASKDASGVSRDALGSMVFALMEHTVKQDPGRCEALFAHLCHLLSGLPPGSLCESLDPEAAARASVAAARAVVMEELPRRPGMGAAGVPGGAGQGGGAGASGGVVAGGLALPDLSNFLIRVAASQGGAVPASTRALATQVGVCAPSPCPLPALFLPSSCPLPALFLLAVAD
jgi:hypothetical protein